MSDEVADYLMEIVTRTRTDSRFTLGVSTRGAIAPLELAAEMVDVPSEVPYTPKLLALTFMGQCDKDPADRYKTLLGREEGNILGEAAMATAVPEDFVTALVSHTLSKMPSAKFL